MRVTVCEMSDESKEFEKDWRRLVRHVQSEASELVLLPEMVFSPWLFWRKTRRDALWRGAVKAHEDCAGRLVELSPAVVLGTRPVSRGRRRLNEGFIWQRKSGFRTAHEKFYLPDEPGFWEASWYDRGNGDFVAQILPPDTGVGFTICTDLWFFEHSRSYGQAGVQLIVCPRATPKLTIDKWLAGGRAAAVVSGAYCLSSNRVNSGRGRTDLGGLGWIVGPDGEVLGLTNRRQPYVTLDLDLRAAEQAKQTYPRYVGK